MVIARKHQIKIQLIDTITRRMLKRGECIISKIASTQTFEWLTSDIAKEMDQEYYLGESGYKNISVLYQNLLHIGKQSFVAQTDDEDEIIGTTNNSNIGVVIEDDTSLSDAINKLVPIILNKYGDKWQRLWDAFIETEYAPLENYSMVESETINDDVSHKGTIGESGSNSSTDTHNLASSDTETGGVTSAISGTPIDKVYPSFSSTATPVKETTQSTTQTTTYNNHKHELTDTGTLSVSGSNSKTTTFGNSDERDISRSHTRSGNIGVTTSQQMLQSEIDIRNNFNLINQIYRDLDKILTSYVW